MTTAIAICVAYENKQTIMIQESKENESLNKSISSCIQKTCKQLLNTETIQFHEEKQNINK
jgi:hypothetical protein